MVRIGKAWFAAMAVVMCSKMAAAQGLSASVDRTEASMQEQFMLTVTVTGSQSDAPTLPALPMFEVQSRGRSAQMQIINGHVTTSAAYSYSLQPKKFGTFTVGPATVTIDGKTYQSAPFAVTVTAPSAAPLQEGSALFTIAETSSQAPYVGQQIIYTWRFYRRVRVASANVSNFDFGGMAVQDLGERREYDTVLRGQQYTVTEIRKALFAEEPGTITLPPTNLQCEVITADRRNDLPGSPFDDFFGRGGQRQTRVLRTQPIELRVQALPPAPPGFSGLVGEFHVDAQLGQTDLKVGDSTTLTLTVRGNGNFQRVAEPLLVGLQGFKVYDDKPTTTVNTSGSVLMGEKTFKKAMVPVEAGTLTIPAAALTYFDPLQKAYRTSSGKPFAVHVDAAPVNSSRPPVPAPDFGTSGPAKIDVQILGDDILPIHRESDGLQQRRFNQTQQLTWGLAFVFPPGAFAAFALWVRRRSQAPRQAHLRRRSRALKRGLQDGAAVAALVNRGEGAPAAALASRILREYLGLKLGVEGLALTPGEARALVEAQGVTAKLAEPLEAWLARCDAAQYGAAGNVANPAGRKLHQELESLMHQLEGGLRK